MDPKKQRWLLALVGIALVGAFAWRWKQAHQTATAPTEVWIQVVDDSFGPDKADHSSRWDKLVQVDDTGGLYPRSWLHALTSPLPRGPFRLKADLQFVPGQGARWIELAAASPVEYFDEEHGGTTSPRSRYAGVFGRVDLGDGFATLTVGQMRLDSVGRRVVARRLEMNTAGALPPLELSLQEDRLQLRFGTAEVSTLADQIPSRLSADMRFGVRGERSKLLHLSAQVLSPTAEDRALVEAETYLALGRNDQALPALAEMAALSPTPRLQIRLARAYEQVNLPERAAPIWPLLTDTAKAGFYAGYAQLELLRARARENADPLALDKDLARLSKNLIGHPVVPQLNFLRARLLALGDTGKETARSLALEAMAGGDPEVSAEALEFLSHSALAYPPAELLALLDQQAASHPPSFLMELLAAKRAELSLQLEDLKGLATNAQDCRVLSYSTRKKVYGLLAQALESGKAAKALKDGDGEVLARLLGEPASDTAWVMDYLFVRAFPQYYTPEKRKASTGPADRAFVARLHSFTRLPKGGKAPAAPFYDSPTAKASAYGQLQQSPLQDDANGLCLNFDSGDYWGCGIAIPGAFKDLRGARTLHAKVLVPKGIIYYISLSESGVGSPTSPSFAGEDGADGEHYLFDPREGSGTWEDLDLPLQSATLSFTWGNLEGNHLLDLQAIAKIDLAITGKQGSGRVCIKDVRFK